MDPTYPLYIPSKGRHDTPYTMAALHHLRLPFHVIVESQQVPEYAPVVKHFGGTLLVLDPAYQRDYDPLMDLPDGASRGSGPARNFGWDHSVAEGHAWHWMMDDNIPAFEILNRNRKFWAGDGTMFRAMEDFASRYHHVSMVGPNYDFFVPARARKAPFTLNTRIYSCNLIRNDVPYRWRGRYNEDTILSLDMLKDGWNTVLFNVFLQKKLPTQKLKGGNTDEIYADGTREKTMMLVRLHPDVARPVMRYGREHHHVDYSGFTHPLRRREDVTIPTAPVYDFAYRPRARRKGIGTLLPKPEQT